MSGWAPPSGNEPPQVPPPGPPPGFPPGPGTPGPVQPFLTPVSTWNPGPAQAWLPRPYTQLLRGPTFRWWRPLVSLLVVLGLLVGVIVAAAVGYGVYLAVTGATDATQGYTDAQFNAWTITPVGLAVTNLVLAALIPAAQVGVWAGFGWRPRWVASVVGGIRWGWLLRCYLVSAVVFGGITVGLTALSGGVDVKPEKQALALVAVVLLTTPLQAAGEEYLFRGWLPQVIGSWISRPLVGAVLGGLVSSGLFAWAHGDQDLWLFADRFGFGVVASWLVWRTGGLEAGIALHGFNNLLAFGFAILSGQMGEMLDQTTGTAGSAGIDVAMLLATAFVIDRLARRGGIARTFHPPVRAFQPPPPVPGIAGAPW